jgi:MFS family permease
MASVLRSARQTATAQLELLLFLYRDPRFRSPLIVIVVATFGGSLHSSVTTYFYLKLGASDTDIGWIGFFFHIGSLFTPPLYGWLMDKNGGYVPMLICVTLCATGCLVRGLAHQVSTLYIAAVILGLGGVNLWNVVLSYMSANTPSQRRSLVVSGFLFQVTAVRIVGTSLYPLWSKGLHSIWPGVDDALFRDQLSMGVCTFFCFYGLFQLLCFGQAVRQTRPPSALPTDTAHEQAQEAPHVEGTLAAATHQKSRARSPSPATADGDAGPQHSSSSMPSPQQKGQPLSTGGGEEQAESLLAFAVAAVALVAQSAASTIGSTLWPLYVPSRSALARGGMPVDLGCELNI